jgi:hypothetical protein
MSRRHLIKGGAAASAAALLLAGCVSPVAGPSGQYATPIGNAPVTANPTPYSAALYCLADYARRYNLPSPRMAVGRISDYTGTVSADGGRQITGGASLMANSALAKAGARIVGREPQAGRHLLGAGHVALEHLGDRAALEGHDALVGLSIRRMAGRVERDHAAALAVGIDQCGQVGFFRADMSLAQFGCGTKTASLVAFSHQQRDRAIAMDLKHQTAFELERC